MKTKPFQQPDDAITDHTPPTTLQYMADGDVLIYTIDAPTPQAGRIVKWTRHPYDAELLLGYNADGVLVELQRFNAKLEGMLPITKATPYHPLKAIRNKLGISQNTLALITGVSPSFISDLERNRYENSYKSYRRIMTKLVDAMDEVENFPAHLRQRLTAWLEEDLKPVQKPFK